MFQPNESGSLNNIFGKKENMELNVVGETLADLSEDSVKSYHGPFTSRLKTILNTIKYITSVSKWPFSSHLKTILNTIKYITSVSKLLFSSCLKTILNTIRYITSVCPCLSIMQKWKMNFFKLDLYLVFRVCLFY